MLGCAGAVGVLSTDDTGAFASTSPETSLIARRCWSGFGRASPRRPEPTLAGSASLGLIQIQAAVCALCPMRQAPEDSLISGASARSLWPGRGRGVAIRWHSLRWLRRPYFSHHPLETCPNCRLGLTHVRIKSGEIGQFARARQPFQQRARRFRRLESPLDAKP
jgi:hypothetical protein